MRETRRRVHGEGGYVVMLTALLMLPLMVAVGFAVDLGFWYTQAEDQQRAADAAALAGVVYLPDTDTATSVALEAARRNGFDDADDDIVVNVLPTEDQTLQVTITNKADLFFSSLVLGDFDISRRATAEYILSVPLGSPRNFIGTGIVGDANMPPDGQENLMMSINGYCTDRMQGDQVASGYWNNSGNNCGGTANPDYDNTNYQLYVDLPETRSYDTDVILFDPEYSSGGGSTACYNPSENYTTGCDFNPGASDSINDMSTIYTLYQADNTPLTDSDNVTMSSAGACTSGPGTQSFAPNTSLDNYTLATTGVASSSNYFLLCRIPSSAIGGRYFITVSNGNNNREGSNNYGVVATPSPSSPGGQRVCDARSDGTCPKVFAKDWLSVRLLGGSGNAKFFLAEIGDEHAGKSVRVNLWDPAEGACSLRIMQPTGPNSWDYVNFDWSATDGSSGTNVSSIPLSGSGCGGYDFNSDLLSIEFDLPDSYDPPDTNAWWRIQYSAVGGVTDRTTWSVQIFGDPVHLIE